MLSMEWSEKRLSKINGFSDIPNDFTALLKNVFNFSATLRTKTFGQVFLTIFYQISLRLKGNDPEGCRKMFFYTRYIYF